MELKRIIYEFFSQEFLPGLFYLAAFALPVVAFALLASRVANYCRRRSKLSLIKAAVFYESAYFSFVGVYWVLLSISQWFPHTHRLFIPDFVTGVLWFLVLQQPQRIKLCIFAGICTTGNALYQGLGFVTTLRELNYVWMDLIPGFGEMPEAVGIFLMATWGILCIASVMLAVWIWKNVRHADSQPPQAI